MSCRQFERIDGPNYVAVRGTFDVTRGGDAIATMHSEKRFFPVQGMTTTEAGIRTNFLADLYVAIGDPENAGAPGGAPTFLTEMKPDTAWAVRAYFNPLVPWIWIGAVVIVFGGMVSLSDRRHRVGAPARARTSASVQPAPGD